MLSTGLGNPYFSTFSSDHVVVSVAYALVSLAFTGLLAIIICLSATVQNLVGNAKANIQDKEGISSLLILHLLLGLRRGKQIYMKTIADTTVTLDSEKECGDIQIVMRNLANQQLEDGHILLHYHILLHSLRGGMQILVKTLADKTFILDAYALFLQLCLPGGMQIFAKTLTAIYLESTFHLVPRLRGGMHIHALEGKTTTLDAEASDTPANVQAKIPCNRTIVTVRQCVALTGKQLEDDLHLVLRLCEGVPIFVKPLPPIIEFQTNLMPNPCIPSM